MYKKLTKRIIFLLAAVLMLSCGSLVYADTVASGTCGDNVTWKLSDDGMLTISGKGDMEEYYYGENSPPWGDQRDKIKRIVIKQGVTSIGESAFMGCVNMKSVEIPKSVKIIEEHAFRECSSLSNITIPNGVTSIRELAFYLCSSLKTVEIPDSVTTIGAEAFYYCSNLEKLTIGSGVASIGRHAFLESSSLLELTIPGNVKEIGRDAFAHCSNLKVLTLEEGIESIGQYAFVGCKRLESIEIPNSVTTIGAGAFSNCDWLKTVHIGKGLTKIPDGMFESCTSLETVTFSKSVKEIGVASFVKCISLSYVELPETIEKISRQAFSGCTNLQLVKLNSSDMQFGKGLFLRRNHVLVSFPVNASYLNELEKQKINYTTTACPIPTGHVVDVTEQAKGGFNISLSWLYEVTYDDVTNPKYIDRISKDEKNLRKMYDELYALMSSPKDDFLKKLKSYEIYLGYEDSKASPYYLYVFNALRYDHPEIFWAVSNIGPDEYNDKTLKELNFENYFASWNELINEKRAFDLKVEEIVGQTEGMSDYEKVCHFAQYFWDNCEYNWNMYLGIIDNPSKFQELCAHTAYGSIMGQKGDTGPMCEGYAAGMKVLCDAANINCSIICGEHDGTPHAWNAIEINGKWYDWDPQLIVQEDIDPIYDPEIIGPITEGFYKTESTVHCEPGTHLWSDQYITVRKATCEDDEIRRFICETCGDYRTESVEGIRLEHSWETDFTVDKKATCTEEGSKSIYCSACNAIKPGSTVAIQKSAHTEEILVGKAATCTKSGLTKGKKCSVCQTVIVAQKVTPKKNHKPGTLKITKKATATKEGEKTQKCTKCNKIVKTVVIKSPKVTLTKATFTYAGGKSILKKSSQLPTVVVKDGKGNIIPSKYYTVTKTPKYMNVSVIGQYPYKITFKNTCKEYTGKATTYLEVIPSAKASVKKTKASGKTITVKWTPVKKSERSQISGYEVTLATDKKFTKNVKKVCVKGNKESSVKISKLKGKTKYYVQIRTYKQVGGVKTYSAPSKYKTCKTK